MPTTKRTNRYTAREVAALRFARHLLGDTRHEHNVTAMASRLFRITRAAGMHELGAKHHRILRFAALLHDVGRCLGERNHPADGARIILGSERLPLSARQCRCVAYLTRYHRGAVPKIGFDEILRRGDGRTSMRLLLAILRGADALDSRQFMASPKIKMTLRGKRLTIDCVTDETSRSFARRKKFRLLEETMELRVETNVRVARA